MNRAFKILLLEDSQEDAEMITRVLTREVPDVEYRVAMNRAEYQAQLEEFAPEVVLSDNSLPQFNAMEALSMLRSKSQYIPFILVTGTVSEEFAAGIIKLGADDYILKDRLIRLPSAIENALKQRRAEQERLVAMDNLRLSEENLLAIFENTTEGFILADRYAIIKMFNENARRYISETVGTEIELGMSIFRMVSPERQQPLQEIIARVLSGERVEYEKVFERADKQVVWLAFSITPVWKNAGVQGVCTTFRNITDSKLAEDTRRDLEREMANQKMTAQKQVTREIIKAQENERNRIGQELHDNVNQILAGAKMFLSSAGKSDERLEKLIRYPMELIDKCMDEIRMLSKRQVTPLKDVDLKELVESLLQDLEHTSPIKARLVYELPQAMEDDLNLNIYRIVQEQVSNVVKHANATQVSIEMVTSGGNAVITIADNGVGFDVQKKRNGVGISNMINRIGVFNGRVWIRSSPGEGTLVQITVPLAARVSD